MKLVGRVCGALAVGVFVSLWMIQNSTGLQDMIGKKILHFLEDEWAAGITCERPAINFFTCSMYLSNAVITPKDDKDFSWSFKRCKIHISPFALIFDKAVHLYLTIQHINADTRATNEQIDIAEHVKTMLKQRNPNLKISPRSITLSNITLKVRSADDIYESWLPGTFVITQDEDLRKPNYSWHGEYDIQGGRIRLNNKIISDATYSKMKFGLNKNTDSWELFGASRFKSVFLNPKATYSVSGDWVNEKGTLSLTDSEGESKIACTWSEPLMIGLKGTAPVKIFDAVIRNVISSSPLYQASTLKGKLDIDAVLIKKDNKISASGTINAQGLGSKTFDLGNIRLMLDEKTNASNAHIEVNNKITNLDGTLSWDLDKKQCSLTLTNTQELLSHAENKRKYSVEPHDFMLKADYTLGGKVQGTYRCTITNTLTNKQTPIRGAVLVDGNSLKCKGFTKKGDYHLSVGLTPQPHIKDCHYKIGDRTIINLTSSAKNPYKIEGSAHWNIIKNILGHNLQHSIMGKNCMFDVSLDQTNLTAVEGAITLRQGRFYIPEVHNLVQGAACTFNLNAQDKTITIHNAEIKLSKGSIVCSNAYGTFNEFGQLDSIHAPICMNDLFINWKRDLYAMIYGNVTISKKPHEAPLLSGNIVIKNALLKRAFFEHQQQVSTSLSMPLVPFPITTDIHFMTERPIKTKTSNLDAHVGVDIHVKSTSCNDIFALPEIAGNIHLNNGWIKVLNHKLMIESGKIQFIAHNMNDPMLDLVAKNRIGKYQVTMQASGSVKKPTITLESNPELTEEQIIGLLFTGSENATLQADLPSMLLQNLDSILFATEKETTAGMVMDTITKTFKYVQITPNLTADPNKSILKGSFSLNLTDQLRAKIDKGLDLQENLSAQLEYMLTDDINLRFVGQQQGEIGSEIELRLKL